MKCIIYKIFVKEEPNTVYVGRTLYQLPYRVYQHKVEKEKTNKKSKSKKNMWIQNQLNLGRHIYAEELESFDTNEAGISEKETYWIQHFLNLGFELLNSGTTSKNNKIQVSEVTKMKLSKSSTESWSKKRKKVSINFKEFFHDFYSGVSFLDMSKKYNVSYTYVKSLISGTNRANETKPYRKKGG